MSILVLLMVSLFVADRLWERQKENELIKNGATVLAKIVAGENKINNMPVGPTDAVRLVVHWPEGDEELPTSYLTGGGLVGGDVTLHVDRGDHTRWTDRAVPTPLLDSLFVGLLALPVVGLFIVIAVVHRRKLEQIWKTGRMTPAVIFDRKQSPIAPMSYAIRFSQQNHPDKQLFTAYVPRAATGLEKGDLIWVIFPIKKGKPLAALWMQSSGSGAV